MSPLGHAGPHRLQDSLVLLFEYFGRDPRLAAGLAQDCCIGISLHCDARQRDLKSGHAPNAPGNGVDMDAVAAAQQRTVDIEQVRILPVPVEIRLDRNAGFRFCCVFSMIAGSAVSPGGSPGEWRCKQDVRCAVDA